MNIKDVLDKSIQFLKSKNVENARFEAEYLLQHLLKYSSRVDLYLNFDKPLTENETQEYRDYIIRKSKSEPTAYILGYKWFYNYKFFVGPGVLIPRPETEFLVEQAILFAKNYLIENNEISIADLGAGTGCIGLTVSLELKKIFQNKKINLDLYEKSATAAKYLNENINFLNAEGHIHAKITNTDLNSVESLNRQYDMILSNPPYIQPNSPEVAKDVHMFEPHLALYCEENGFECIRKWSVLAANTLNKHALLGLEISHDQNRKTQNFLKELDLFSEIKSIEDHNGIQRIIIAKKKS